VDDEQDIVDVVKYNLQKEGYAVLTARNGKQALDQARHLPHLVLLDVMMPERDGLEVLRELKSSRQTAQIPVIFLTAKGADIDEVLGLELGADDYIVKPISIPKLMARIKAVLRKQEHRESPGSAPESIIAGVVEISPSQHRVRIQGKEVFFPKKEFEVLTYLASHPEQVINRETLLNAIWGSDVLVVDRTVDVHIRKIREKLGKHADQIETVKGIGYRMKGG
jgi:two-component system alkaline phosphatase synthesis response regulator PhoP